MRRPILYLLPLLLLAGACGHKAEPVQLLRFEQMLFAQAGSTQPGTAADFDSPLLNYHPDDPEFMMAVLDFVNDEVVRSIYHATDSLYHDLGWLADELGTAMARARRVCPQVDYRRFYTLITADIGNYTNRTFCHGTDMAISIDHYALGHAASMQRFGVPAYITRLCRREYMVADIMATAVRSHIALPEGELTLLDCAIAEGKTLHFLDHVLPSTPDTIKLRYSRAQLEWMQENAKHVWGWMVENDALFSRDMSQLHNLIDDAPKTNAFGDGSAPRTHAWLGWQIVKQYVKKSGIGMEALLAETDSRKILNQSGWRP
jgi:hypothetical protein